ncbi:hypothetical protein SEA_WIDOW_40 [Gordonia phage Widow]|nr:hypothetical protein SEA_PUPPERS_38 [Gordonia phage Puppers]UTN93332.1 hypothetical protein SEA_WIDOW_40 [Gordonia phage Widow]
MSRTLYVRTLAAVLGGLTTVALGACATDGSRAGESQLTPAPVVTVTETTVSPAPRSTATETTTEEAPVAPTTRTDESHEAELPYEVQVYVSMAKDLVANGTVPASAVTPLAVKEDVAREYGIQLTEAQAERAVAEILGYAR